MKTAAELDRIHARARHAWDAAATPTTSHVDNRREQAVDQRAENKRDQDNYEYAQLIAREESF